MGTYTVTVTIVVQAETAGEAIDEVKYYLERSPLVGTVQSVTRHE